MPGYGRNWQHGCTQLLAAVSFSARKHAQETTQRRQCFIAGSLAKEDTSEGCIYRYGLWAPAQARTHMLS